MGRRRRIVDPGIYYVSNSPITGVEPFNHPSDREAFVRILCRCAGEMGARVHAYALTPSGYRIVIETSKPNLPGLMRRLGTEYALRYNSLHRRVGPLWARRYASIPVGEEDLRAVVSYVEQTPVREGLSASPGGSPHTSLHKLLTGDPPECLKDSAVARAEAGPDRAKAMIEYCSLPVAHSDILRLRIDLKEREVQRLTRPEPEPLESIFKEVRDMKDRNERILAALDQGHSQHAVAAFLGISQPAVHGVVSRMRRKSAAENLEDKKKEKGGE